MITGTVNADLEAIIRLTVRGPTGQARAVKAIIDTGFDGWLTLTPKIVAALGLPWRKRDRAPLADGSIAVCDVFHAAVVWDRRRHFIEVDEADTTPLVGTALLARFELNIQFLVGGKVTIKALGRRGRP
jgi:clan AA aspartic protease